MHSVCSRRETRPGGALVAAVGAQHVGVVREQQVDEGVAPARGEAGLDLQQALHAQPGDDRLGVGGQPLRRGHPEEVGVEAEEPASRERLGHRPGQGAVGPEAEERGALQPREVGLAGVVLVEDDEVERGRAAGVEEARTEGHRAVARPPQAAEEARLAGERLLEALLDRARERATGQDRRQDQRGGPRGSHRVEAREPGERLRAAGRKAGLEELVLERVEDEVVDVRPGGVPSRPEERRDVAGRGRGAAVEAGREGHGLAGEEEGGEHGQEPARAPGGQHRRAKAATATSQRSANSDAPGPVSRTQRPRWLAAGRARRKPQATKPTPTP